MRRVGEMLGVAVSVAFFISCSGSTTEEVDGPAPADLASEAPYGVGAEIGRNYDYVLLAHCGVHWIRIDGVWWETEPLDDGHGNRLDGWGDPWDAGTLVLIDEDTAEYSGGPGVTVRFERTEFAQYPGGGCT